MHDADIMPTCPTTLNQGNSAIICRQEAEVSKNTLFPTPCMRKIKDEQYNNKNLE